MAVEELKVIDTREHPQKNAIKRRRACLRCGYRFSTLETIVQESLWVLKRNKSKEKFDLNKIRLGIEKAAEKRPFGQERLQRLVQNIYEQILSVSDSEISSEVIGQIVLNTLKQEDPVVYMRFASVYKEFKNLTDWQEEIKNFR